MTLAAKVLSRLSYPVGAPTELVVAYKYQDTLIVVSMQDAIRQIYETLLKNLHFKLKEAREKWGLGPGTVLILHRTAVGSEDNCGTIIIRVQLQEEVPYDRKDFEDYFWAQALRAQQHPSGYSGAP